MYVHDPLLSPEMKLAGFSTFLTMSEVAEASQGQVPPLLWIRIYLILTNSLLQ
ncbi:hypothetical protein GCM10008986_32840 [Salinibacillus aidingensis]|uniref:Uncharacterized protein n=1 Tax=Salinibacillus aidingensis TaxID=237684 RepID=A0ABN1BPZ5_9BACI